MLKSNNYMGSRRLIKIAKHAVQIQFNSVKGFRIDKHSYAKYRGTEWIFFSYFDGSDFFDGKIYVSHSDSNCAVRIHLDRSVEDPVTGDYKHFQLLNNCLLYDASFAPVIIPFLNDYQDERYFVYDIRKEAANA